MAALEEPGNMQWYYAKGQQQQGPVSAEEIRTKVRHEELSLEDLIWREGMANWTPLREVAEFADLRAIPATGVPTAGPATGNPYHPPASRVAPVLGGGGAVVPNYLWQSIAVTILCCWPFGIPAIVYAARVSSLQASGDLEGARKASEQAKLWCWVSFGSGLAAILIYVALIATGAVKDM